MRSIGNITLVSDKYVQWYDACGKGTTKYVDINCTSIYDYKNMTTGNFLCNTDLLKIRNRQNGAEYTDTSAYISLNYNASAGNLRVVIQYTREEPNCSDSGDWGYLAQFDIFYHY